VDFIPRELHFNPGIHKQQQQASVFFFVCLQVGSGSAGITRAWLQNVQSVSPVCFPSSLDRKKQNKTKMTILQLVNSTTYNLRSSISPGGEGEEGYIYNQRKGSDDTEIGSDAQKGTCGEKPGSKSEQPHWLLLSHLHAVNR
jgi:hypothetical protein